MANRRPRPSSLSRSLRSESRAAGDGHHGRWRHVSRSAPLAGGPAAADLLAPGGSVVIFFFAEEVTTLVESDIFEERGGTAPTLGE